MDWKQVGKAVADAAPMLGGLLGGPAGGAVGSLIASTLGTAADPDAIMAKIQSDPVVLMQIKRLEADERQHIRDLQIQTLQAELADVQSARVAHANSKMPAIITVCLGIMTIAAVSCLVYYPIPDNNRDLAINYGSQIIGLFGTAVAYWIGTSRSSANKDAALLAQK